MKEVLGVEQPKHVVQHVIDPEQAWKTKEIRDLINVCFFEFGEEEEPFPVVSQKISGILATIDPALHPAIFAYMIRDVAFQHEALDNIRSFVGVDVQAGLQLAVHVGLGDWLIGRTKEFPEMNVLDVVDDLLVRDDVSAIQIASKDIDVSLHDAIAQKLVDADNSLFTLWDDYYNTDFRGLSIELLRKAYEHDVGGKDVVGDAVFNKGSGGAYKQGSRVWAEYLGNMSRFVNNGKEMISFWLERGFLDEVAQNLAFFATPYGKENCEKLLRPNDSGSVWKAFSYIVVQAEDSESGKKGDMDNISLQEIYQLVRKCEGGMRLIAEKLYYFVEFLDEADLRYLIDEGRGEQVFDAFHDISLRETVAQKRDLAQRMFDLGLSKFVAEKFVYYQKGVSDETLMHALLADGEYRTLAWALGRHQPNNVVRRRFRTGDGANKAHSFLHIANMPGLVQRFIDDGQDAVLAEYLPNFDRKFEEIDGESAEDELERRRHFQTLEPWIDHEALAHRLMDQFEEQEKEWSEESSGLSKVDRPQFLDSPLMKYYDNFRIPGGDITMRIIRMGGGRVILSQMRHFLFGGFSKIPKPNDTQIMELLFETGQVDVVAQYIDLFDESFDRNIVAHRILDAGEQYLPSLLSHLILFRDLDQKCAVRMFERPVMWHDVVCVLPRYESVFKGGFGEEVSKLMVEGMVASGIELSEAIVFNDTHGKPDRILGSLYDAFGLFFTQNVYRVARDIMSGVTEDGDMKRYGVTHHGAVGVQEFIRFLRNKRSEMNKGVIDHDEILKDDVVADWFMQVVRYSESQWGQHDMHSARTLIRDHQQLEGNGEIVSLPDAYAEPIIVSVKNKGSMEDVEKPFAYGEGFLSRYNQLLDSLVAVQHGDVEHVESESKREKGLSELIQEMEDVRNQVLVSLKEKREGVFERVKARGGDAVRASDGIQQWINLLEEIDFSRISEPQKMFVQLRGFKEFESVLRKLMLYFGLRYGGGVALRNFAQFDRMQPTADDIAFVIDVVDHITNQELLEPLFADDKARKELSGLLNVSALEEEYVRMQDYLSGAFGAREVRIACQRNILTEMSGHICDACWSNVHASILKDFPNIVSFTFEQAPGDPRFERLVGAGLLIETESETDEPLLVIRGNNPIESFVNQVDPFDLLLQQVEYFESIAEKRGRTLAIVMDERSWAGTNRQAIQTVYDILKQRLSRVPLKTDVGTKFNGYDIKHKVYLISADDFKKVIEERKKK